MAISEEQISKKLRKLNKIQIDIWNGFVEATIEKNSTGISSSKLAKILLIDPGNIQRRLNKFASLGLVEKKNSDFIICTKNIVNIFPYIPLEYRINQETLKIERISSFIEESLKLIIEKKIEKMTSELFEIIDQEYKKKKDFNDVSYEWLDKPDKEFEAGESDIEVEREELQYPPLEEREFFDEEIASFEEDEKPVKEIDQVTIEKDDGVWMSKLKQTKDECEFCGKKLLNPSEIRHGHHIECLINIDRQYKLNALKHFEELKDWIDNHRSSVFLNNLKPNEEITPEILATVTEIRFVYNGTDNFERIHEFPESFGELINLERLTGQVDELPFNIGDLVNLEEIDIAGGEQLITLPVSISKLKNLRTLRIQWGDLSDFSEVLPSVREFSFSGRYNDWEEKTVPEFITNIHHYLPNASSLYIDED